MTRVSSFGCAPGVSLARRLAVLSGAALLAVGVLHGAATAEEEGPRNFTCTFESGASWSYEDGSFKSTAPHPLSFSIRDIDLDEQTATLSLEPDAEGGKLNVVRAINANHFIEVVTEGFLNLTTVYDRDEKTGKHPAVHSRHFGLLGQPMFGQYTGFCGSE